MFTFARKALTVAGAAAMLIAGLAGPASASNGLIYNRNTQQCIAVASNAGVGSRAFQTDCNNALAYWDWGSLGLLENRVKKLCLEVPNGGGYAYLQNCGGPYQNMDLVASTGLIAVHNDNQRFLGIDGTGWILAATYPAPNQIWSW